MCHPITQSRSENASVITKTPSNQGLELVNEFARLGQSIGVIFKGLFQRQGIRLQDDPVNTLVNCRLNPCTHACTSAMKVSRICFNDPAPAAITSPSSSLIM
jgi:hypothetical protein